MVCNTINGSSCSCPTFVSTNKCDCPVRVSGFEYYSNGYTCVSELTYGNPCNYSCQYLTQNTICRNGIFSCPSLKYFNTIQKNCTNQQLINQTCSLSTDCRSDLGLICDSGLCNCDSSIQYWFGSSCTNYLTYNNGICTSDDQCFRNLICRLSGSTCACPSIIPT